KSEMVERISTDKTNLDNLNSLTTGYENLFEKIKDSALDNPVAMALKSELADITDSNNFESLSHKIDNEVAKKSLQEKVNALNDFKIQKSDVYNSSDPQKKNEFDQKLTEAENLLKGMLTNASSYEETKKKLEELHAEVSDPKVAEYIKSQIESLIETYKPDFSDQQVQDLKTKLNALPNQTSDVKAWKAKLEKIKENNDQLKVLDQLNSDQKTVELQKLIQDIDNETNQQKVVEAAKKKQEILKVLEDKVTYPQLEKTTYLKQIYDAPTVDKLNEIQTELGIANARKDLEDQIKKAQEHLQNNNDKFIEADPTGKSELEALINEANVELQKQPQSSAEKFKEKLDSIKNKVASQTLEHFVNKLKEKLTKDIESYSPVLSADNITKLKEKLNNSALNTYEQVKEEFAKVQKVKEKADKINTLTSLTPQTATNYKNKLVEQFGNDGNLSATTELAEKVNETIRDFDSSYPHVDKNSKVSDIESASDLNAFNTKKEELAKENAKNKLKKAIDKAEKYKRENSDLYNDAEESKRNDFDAKLKAAQDGYAETNLKSVQDYTTLEQNLEAALTAISPENVVAQLKARFSTEIEGFTPELSSRQIAKLKELVNSDTLTTRQAVKDVYNKIKAFRPNAKQINDL
ncbi:hypothetical protein, partial [Mycoplasma nasistruthionis]|uniref:hypothetical protein n=1 Tax=Mycoplasma nasistruthionis TaxID=353852 RepID=UPI001C9E9BF0